MGLLAVTQNLEEGEQVHDEDARKPKDIPVMIGAFKRRLPNSPEQIQEA
jgi:hypothetical protein